MKTLNEEIARIHSEIAEIASKAFTGKTIQERFAEITPQEYDASEEVWNELHRRRKELLEELSSINNQIEAVEKIINQPIKKA
jgi:wobble nucleotide-excising tRNase